MCRQRVLRRLLRKHRQQKNLDKHLYHYYYYRHAKGNACKNKRVLIEAIHKMKAERTKAKALQEQQEARKERAKLLKARKAATRDEARAEGKSSGVARAEAARTCAVAETRKRIR